MAGLCGWYATRTLENAEARLATMAASLGRASRDLDDGFAIAAAGVPGQTSSIHREGSVLAGWVGRIDWARSPHRDLAEEAGDGPAIAAAYTDDGLAFVEKLAGDVAIALSDAKRRRLLIAIDRAGVRKLAYCTTQEGIFFATSGASLQAAVSTELDPQAVFDYVHFHMVPAPRAIFRGWRKLLPGELVVVRDGETEHRRHWTPRYVDRARASPPEVELAREYRESVRRAVGTCVSSSSGRIGAFLSGGTDSSTVAGVLGEVTGEPARTYSIGFDVPGYDESRYARIAVDHFGTSHHEYVITPKDVLEAAPRLARDYDEPFGNASAVASLHCAELARADGIGTLLGGDGGDEIFAGNERYAKQKIFENYYRIPAPLRKGVVEPLAGMLPVNGLTPLRKIGSYVRQARVPLPDRLETYNFLERFPPSEVFDADFLGSIETAEPLRLMRERYHEAPTSSVLNRLLYLDLKFTLADNDLRKVSRTCEMAGVDVRYPFLDPGLVELANRVPPGLKLKGRKLRYFFKRASEGFLPSEILTKQKHGFGVPCGRWMRDDAALRELAYDSLDSLGKRGYVSAAFLSRLKALHAGDHVDYYGVMVWVLTMLELWLQQHAD